MSNALANPSSLIEKYRAELELLSDLISQAGVKMVAYRPENLENLRDWSDDRLSAKIDELKAMNALYMSAVEREPGSDYSDRQMAWAALRTLGMRPLSDVFSLITDQDSIEVFSAQHQQLFRSFNSFRCFSYTLDEMCQNEWWKLFERDDQLTAGMFRLANVLLAQTEPATLLKPFEPHWVKEKFSSRQNQALLEPRLVTPLIATSGSRQIVGYMSVIRVVQLESLKDESGDH